MSFDISHDLHPLRSNIGLDAWKKIRQNLIKLQEQIEDYLYRKYYTYSPFIDVHNTTVVAGTADVDITPQLSSISWNLYHKYIPDLVRAYDLIHNEGIAGGITFPDTISKKFGAAGQTDGNSYITIDNHSWLNPTDKISAVGWLYLPATAGGDLEKVVFSKGVTDPVYKLAIRAHADAVNTLRATVKVGGVLSNIDYVYTPNAWLHYAKSWKGAPDNRFKFYINKVQQGATITTSGALNTNAEKLGLWAYPDGTNKLKNLSRKSWESYLHAEITQAWINDHFDGLLNTDDMEEITTLPYHTNIKPQPDAFAGLCIATT